MTAMERLVAADEQRRRLLRIEGRAQQRQRPLGPILRRAVRADAQIEFFRRNEHPVGVGEAPGIDAVEPDRERIAEHRTGLLRWADEIRNNSAAGFNHAVAHPAHAAGMLDAIFVREAEVAGQIGAHRIGIEGHRVDERASALASVVLPAPGNPMIRILRFTSAP
jgi:hypothetical protein